MRRILAVNMEFLANQEEISSRLDFSGVCASSHDAEPKQRGKRRLSPNPAEGKRLKRERLASMFLGVCRFWRGEQLLYKGQIEMRGQE